MTYSCVFCSFTSNSKIAISNHLSRTEKLIGEDLELLKLKTFHPLADIEYLVSAYGSGQEGWNSIRKKYGVDLGRLLQVRGIKRTHAEEKHTVGYKQRYADSCFATYGVTNPSKLGSIKTKKKETNLKKFGVSCNLQIPLSREKATATWKSNSAKNIASIKTSMLGKYGVENRAQIPEVRLKNSCAQKTRFAVMSKDELREVTAKAREKLTLMPQLRHQSSKIEFSS